MNESMRRYRATAKYQSLKQARERKYQYGISQEQFEALIAAQNGCCAICGLKYPVAEGPPHKRLGVDHDHNTGKIRGLLCRRCNIAIGALQDNPIYRV